MIAVTERSGYWLTLLLTAAPLYLTYKMYRAGRESEARQGAILEAAHDAIITMDPHLNIREFNPAAEQMFGRLRTEILGRRVDVLAPAGPQANGPRRAQAVHGDGRGSACGPPARTGGDAGRRHRIPGRADRGAHAGGDSRAVITGFIRDITERRALEEQLRQSQKLEAIGRLAGGVAHDFNNILMSIMGSADLLLMELGVDDPARGEADEIKQSVERGAGVTRQLLAFGRRQATRAQARRARRHRQRHGHHAAPADRSRDRVRYLVRHRAGGRDGRFRPASSRW